jgi:D-alanyl-D-alanine carboxypeptidase
MSIKVGADLDSPYVSGELFASEPNRELPAGAHRAAAQSPFLRSFAVVNEGGLAPERFARATIELDDEDAVSEWEQSGCAGEDEQLATDSEWFEAEVWSNSAEQIAFRDRVLADHIARSKAARGSANQDWPDESLTKVLGTDISTLPDTATAAGRLLAAANIDLAREQRSGVDDAVRTVSLSAVSGYRSSKHQRSLWNQYFSAKGGYYDRTHAARQKLIDGPHSEQAVKYMLRRKKDGGFGLTGRIAAPGYSNHQSGIAIDFWQERHKGHFIANKSSDVWRARWRASWFHRWLKTNAAGYGFKPIATEEWHWEYKPEAGVGKSRPKIRDEVIAPDWGDEEAFESRPIAHLGDNAEEHWIDTDRESADEVDGDWESRALYGNAKEFDLEGAEFNPSDVGHHAAGSAEDEVIAEAEWTADNYEPAHKEVPEELVAVQKELFYEDDAHSHFEAETGDATAPTRMKFEIQTSNRIWRNDGKSASLLARKYGPTDWLVNRNGARLESETDGVLEFETEWFRSWNKLEGAMKKAVAMTEEINKAGPSKYVTTRKAFPFSVEHLRKGSTREVAQGFWEKKPGMEGKSERILRAGEELEVELTDSEWKAGIQSSESFLLEYYESFLRQHEWPFYRDGTIKYAKAVLDAATTRDMPVTDLAKLRALLQVIVNYILRGQGGAQSEDAGAYADVAGEPSKQAFTLMSRTNFASMYKVLLTEKEKGVLQKIVNDELLLKEMGLNRKSPVFVRGYGKMKPGLPLTRYAGPTVHGWLGGIVSGMDVLSVQSGKGLSAAMGRYNVETRRGRNDRWLVKFETRNTILGAVEIGSKDWVKYAKKLFDQASERERDALRLFHQQGVADESKLTNFVFHARHPELGGRRIRKDERALAQEWLQIRAVLVRPILIPSGDTEQ